MCNIQSIFNEALQIEEEEDLWNYKISGECIWPLIRNTILMRYVTRNKNFQIPHAHDNFRSYLMPQYLRSYCITFKKLYFSKYKKYDALFFTSARNQHYNNKIKRYIDQSYYYYFNFYSNPLIFEASYQSKIPSPRYLENNYCLKDFIILTSYIKYSIKGISHAQKNKLLAFIKHVCKKYSLENYNLYYNKIYNLFICSMGLNNTLEKIYKLIDNKSLAYIHGGSYLSLEGIITKKLKQKGIITIECQHGYIGSTHSAYNFPNNSIINKAKDYLPDYLLTYGDYWNENINSPSKKVAVGNPLLNDMVNDINNSICNNTILIISQGIITDYMVNIAKFLSINLPQYTIIFKLHPGEVPFISRYIELNNYSNIHIKTYENIYNLISISDIVIGYTSTSLYEAIAFNKKIFILDNEVIPDDIGTKFSNHEELINLIYNGKFQKKTNVHYYWKKNWHHNFINFQKEVLENDY
jgi:hypothetical protein